MIGLDLEDLATLWVSEVGTEPPAFGEESPWDHLDELRRMSWADSILWAERIKGGKLLPGQIRKLQKAHGFDLWNRGAKKTALRRLSGNGKHDPDGTEPPQHGSWASVNGWNPHNRRVAGAARRLRSRVLAYCRTAYFRALKSGAAFPFKEVFAAACARIFGRRQPYANRSRVKAFRDWVEAKLEAKNVTHPPEAAPYSAAPAMFYASTEARNEIRNMTHLPGAAGGPTEEGHGQPGLAAPAGRAAACGAAPGGAAPGPSPADADSSFPEGPSPSRRASDGAAGPTPEAVRQRRSRARLVGIARSALPTLLQAHIDVAGGKPGLIGWDFPLPGAPTQEKWALGWLTAWIRKGRSVRRLAEVYAEGLSHFDRKYRAAGFAVGDCAPWALRGWLQRRAKDLPEYGLQHFEANPGRFPVAPWLLELREWRAENRERIAAFRREEREARHREKLAAKASTAAPVECEETSAWEDEMADFNAEMAAAEMDRRKAREDRAPVNERDAWARDLGWS